MLCRPHMCDLINKEIVTFLFYMKTEVIFSESDFLILHSSRFLIIQPSQRTNSGDKFNRIYRSLWRSRHINPISMLNKEVRCKQRKTYHKGVLPSKKSHSFIAWPRESPERETTWIWELRASQAEEFLSELFRWSRGCEARTRVKRRAYPPFCIQLYWSSAEYTPCTG